MNVLFDDLVNGIFHQVQEKVVPALETATQKASQQLSNRLQAPPASTDLVYLTDRLVVLSQPAPSQDPKYLDPGRDVRTESRRRPAFVSEVSTPGNSSPGSSIEENKDFQNESNPQDSTPMSVDDSNDHQVETPKPDRTMQQVNMEKAALEGNGSVVNEQKPPPTEIETAGESNARSLDSPDKMMEGIDTTEKTDPNDGNDCGPQDNTKEPSVPLQQRASAIKNSSATIVSYLDKRHGANHYLAFSLMDEPPEDRTLVLFRRQIVQLGWWSPCIERSENPSISKLLEICYAIHAYLQLDPKNVAVVYCSNGKTRTAIAMACYLKFAGLVQHCYQGFLHFLVKRGIKNPEATWKRLPPSLHLFFRQFGSALDTGGFLNRKPLFLRAIALQGIPVEDKPCLDIWDSSQRHVYSSHPEMWNPDFKSDQNNKSSQWADEEGFYKVNVVLEGDFLLLCRFGGEFARETAIHDPSKILFRYANTTGFLGGGCPYELPPNKVDLTRSYAAHLDDEDFLVTLLFEADWEHMGSDGASGDHSLPKGSREQLKTPGKLCGERIWRCHERDACKEGLNVIFQRHSARPDPSDIQDFQSFYRKQSFEKCAGHLVCLALQLTNFQYKQAERLLLESPSFAWWRQQSRSNDAEGRVLAPPEEKKDPEQRWNLKKKSLVVDAENAQHIFDVLDEIDLTKNLEPNDISRFRDYKQVSHRSQTMMDFQLTPKRRNSSLRSQTNTSSVDLCMRDSGWMVPSLGYPRPGDITGRFGSNYKRTDYVEEQTSTLASRSLPRVPYFPHEGPALFPPPSKRRRTESPGNNHVHRIPPYDRRREVVRQLFMQVRHTGVTLPGLVGLLETSQTWSNMPAVVENLEDNVTTDVADVDGKAIQPGVSKEASMNRKSKEQKEKEWEEARKAEEKGKAEKKEVEDAKKKDEEAKLIKGGSDPNSEVPLEDDPDYSKYFKMLKMGMAKEQVEHAMKRDEKDPRVLGLDPNRSLESQIPEQPETDSEVPLKNDPEYEKYFKMLKMGLPVDAVKNALVRDGKDPSIMDLDPEKSEKSQRANKDGPALKDDPEYAKYFKMQSMGLPVDAVKNALTRDGQDPGIMDLDPNKSLKSQQASSDDTGVPLKDDAEYSKYFKMLSMGLPVDAVKNALTRDGKDPAIMDLDPNKSVQSQLGKNEDVDTGIPLKDDPEYAKYFKMRSMGLPVDAVKNALTRDGKDPGIMDLDPNKSVAYQMKTSTSSKKSPAKKKKKRIRRKKIYWNPINPANLKEDSMWHIVKDAVNMAKLHYDQQEFEELFTESADPKDKKKKKTEKAAKKLIQVIDAKRSMNGGIILARLKIEYSKIAEIVTKMDHNKFDSTQLAAFKEYLADADERRGLIGYMQNSKVPEEALYADLSETEKYMVTMMEVSEPARKFDAMLFRSVFKNRFEDINAGIQTLNTACDQLRASEKFRKLMAMILTVVNQINTGGEGNMAIGFTLDALLKLNEAKAFDKKTSVLHYVVKLVKKNNEALLTFSNDISSVIPAQSVLLDAVGSDVKALGEELVGVHTTVQAEAQRLEEAGELKPMSLEDLKEQKTTPRQVGHVAYFNKIDHHTGRTSMERFTVNAHYSCEQANASIEDVKKKYIALLNYFGEDENMATADFFGILRRFMREFQKAVDQVEAIEKKEAKERKRASARAAKAAKKDATKKDRKGRIRKAAAKQNAKSSSDVDRVKGKEHTKSDLIVGLAATAASLQKIEETDDPVQKPSLSGGIAAMAAVAAASRSGNPKHHDGEDFNDGVAAMAAAAPSSQKGEPGDTGEEPKEGITAMAVPKTLPDNGGERLQAYAGEDNMGETTSESGVVEPPSDGSPIGLVNKIAETNVIATDKSVDSDQKYDNSEAEFVEVSNVPAPEPATENNDAVNMKREILQLPASSSLKSTGFEQKDDNFGSENADSSNIPEPGNQTEVTNGNEKTGIPELPASLSQNSTDLEHKEENGDFENFDHSNEPQQENQAQVDGKDEQMENVAPPAAAPHALTDFERKDDNAAASPQKSSSSGGEDNATDSEKADHSNEPEQEDQTEVTDGDEEKEIPMLHAASPPTLTNSEQKDDDEESDFTELSGESSAGNQHAVDGDMKKETVLPAASPQQSTDLEHNDDVIDATNENEVDSAKEPKPSDSKQENEKSHPSNIETKTPEQATMDGHDSVVNAFGPDNTCLVDAKQTVSEEKMKNIPNSPMPPDDKPADAEDVICGKKISSGDEFLGHESEKAVSSSRELEHENEGEDKREVMEPPVISSQQPTNIEQRSSDGKDESAKMNTNTEGKSDFAAKAAAYRKRRKKAGKDRSKSPPRKDRSKSPSRMERSKSPPKGEKSNSLHKTTTPEDPFGSEIVTPTRQSRFLKSAAEYRQKKSSRNLTMNTDSTKEVDKKSSPPTARSDKGQKDPTAIPVEIAATDDSDRVAPTTSNTRLSPDEKTWPPFFANFSSPTQAQRSSIRVLKPLGAPRLGDFLDAASSDRTKVGPRLGDFLETGGPRLGDFLDANQEKRGNDSPQLGDFLEGAEDDQSEMLRQNYDDSSVAQIADRLHKKPMDGMSTSWTEGDNITNWMGWADQIIKASDSDSVVGFEMPRDLNDGYDFDDDSTIASHTSYASSYYDDLSVASGLQTPGRVSSYISFDNQDMAEISSSFNPYYDDAETPEQITPGIAAARGITPAKVAASILFEDSPPTSIHIAKDDHQGYGPYETGALPASLDFAEDEVGLDAGLSFGADVGFDDGLGGFGGMDGFNTFGDDQLGGLGMPSTTHPEPEPEPEKKDTENRRKSNSWFPWAGG